MKTKQELKLLFENGDKPTQEDFWALLDSYWHKDEKISENAIDLVEKVIAIVENGILSGHSLAIFIPKETKIIKQGAFQFSGMDYQIIEVNFNEGLEEIGAYVFQSQNIKKVKTPSTLKIINNGAFDGQVNMVSGSDSLEEIILNEGLIRIGDYAFNCSRAAVKDLYIPTSVQTVGQNAFALPLLKTVSAPAGLDLSNAGIPATATITYR
ncbi:leucine-rich repeat domain-containing protein [Chryseobacterium oranimense]|uniref:leucine-rich repeat domain-containing protein n=1 Tax=Chryseobacterium oranimense TaxID=421058 RepID=UPI0021AE515D|nr:leucine-rich repeat domain-containing protein [Chryseobacterium oranimense]UWX59658.1 leucine-rich repeat domain-containing protein [Chryseobacterium oranimense]